MTGVTDTTNPVLSRGGEIAFIYARKRFGESEAVLLARSFGCARRPPFERTLPRFPERCTATVGALAVNSATVASESEESIARSGFAHNPTAASVPRMTGTLLGERRWSVWRLPWIFLATSAQ